MSRATWKKTDQSKRKFRTMVSDHFQKLTNDVEARRQWFLNSAASSAFVRADVNDIFRFSVISRQTLYDTLKSFFSNVNHFQ